MAWRTVLWVSLEQRPMMLGRNGKKGKMLLTATIRVVVITPSCLRQHCAIIARMQQAVLASPFVCSNADLVVGCNI